MSRDSADKRRLVFLVSHDGILEGYQSLIRKIRSFSSFTFLFHAFSRKGLIAGALGYLVDETENRQVWGSVLGSSSAVGASGECERDEVQKKSIGASEEHYLVSV